MFLYEICGALFVSISKQCLSLRVFHRRNRLSISLTFFSSYDHITEKSSRYLYPLIYIGRRTSYPSPGS